MTDMSSPSLRIQSGSDSGILQMVVAAASMPTRPSARSAQEQLDKLERHLSVEEIAQFRLARIADEKAAACEP